MVPYGVGAVVAVTVIACNVVCVCCETIRVRG